MIIKNLLLIFLLVFYLTGFVILQNTKVLFVDEKFHYSQIESFVRGDFTLNPNLVMLPGYHLVMSIIAVISENMDFKFLRIFSLAFNLLSFYFFYLAGMILDRKNAFRKTCFFALLPLLFPYVFLLYTDGFSLLTMIISLYLVLRKKYFLSAIAAAFSLFVRQNNLFLVLFLYFLIYYQTNGIKLGFKRIIKHLNKTWIYLVGIILLGFCLIWVEKNTGPTFARDNLKLSWPSLSNIFFTLFVMFFLFLPQNLANFHKIWIILRKKSVILLFLVGLIIFWISFVPIHPYNQDIWFLHNRLFHYFSSDPVRKTVFYLLSFYSLLSLVVTKLLKREYYLFYPAVILYLLPLSMVEFRYAILPVTFLLLFQRIENKSHPGKSRRFGRDASRIPLGFWTSLPAQTGQNDSDINVNKLLFIQGFIFFLISIFFLWGVLSAAFFP